MTQTGTVRPLALVTGASSGIGYALADQFAQHGYDLVIAAEDGGLAEAAHNLESHGAAVEPVQVDLATAEGVERLYAAATARGRHPDAVAITPVPASAATSPAARTWTPNCASSTSMCASTVQPGQAGHRRHGARGSGRILITSSIAGTMPGPFEAVYAASKASTCPSPRRCATS